MRSTLIGQMIGLLSSASATSLCILALTAGRANAQDVGQQQVVAGNASIIKLGLFAQACDAPQIAALFKRDPSFDINSYPATMTPVQLAQARLATAIAANDLVSQFACMSTITTIMKDVRYSWKEVGARQTTDLIHLAAQMKDVRKDIMSVTFGLALEIAKTLKEFDINYRVKAPHPVNMVDSVAGALAEVGNFDAWCLTKSKFAQVALDDRPTQDYYTPLLFAVAANKIDMVKGLIAEGADWDAYLVSMPNDWAAQKIASSRGYAQLSQWLIDHKNGTSAATVGASLACKVP